MQRRRLATTAGSEKLSFLDRIVRFFLDNKLVVFLAVAGIVGWGLMVAPFDWDLGAFGGQQAHDLDL